MITAKQYVRYERHIELCGIGKLGQRQILDSKILMIGVGGLGCPASVYLTGAGVGTITIVDDDTISVSNLHRQFMYETKTLSKSKVLVLKERLESLNPDCKIIPIEARLKEDNAAALIEAHDLVIDGSDNFKTRYLLNEICNLKKKTLVSGAVLHFDGQVYVFKPNGPCYRCLYPDEPSNFEVPSCTEGAILGPVTGVIGTMLATEAIKEILGLGTSLSGHVLLYNSLNSSFKKIAFEKSKGCLTCNCG